ncbi:MAG TPA: hypothetical protein VL181_07330 [Holophagaceae bacterium]|jgi:hypothetical protein|nr:hypothetical protein [Holophagaceae bacterium]
MSNDKKPKKAKPPVIHGATHRGNEAAGNLLNPLKKTNAEPGKKTS